MSVWALCAIVGAALMLLLGALALYCACVLGGCYDDHAGETMQGMADELAKPAEGET